ncbi:unnamed protein product [Spirodela intermedia]|uniref:Uncharacterized protein n=1 Tax=Spirodela intermedia TaxID=51605 RepID=A0A7I8KIG9_SPIIN|nr:unnamed protein product [Spirodela intermedia]
MLTLVDSTRAIGLLPAISRLPDSSRMKGINAPDRRRKLRVRAPSVPN